MNHCCYSKPTIGRKVKKKKGKKFFDGLPLQWEQSVNFALIFGNSYVSANLKKAYSNPVAVKKSPLK